MNAPSPSLLVSVMFGGSLRNRGSRVFATHAEVRNYLKGVHHAVEGERKRRPESAALREAYDLGVADGDGWSSYDVIADPQFDSLRSEQCLPTFVHEALEHECWISFTPPDSGANTMVIVAAPGLDEGDIMESPGDTRFDDLQDNAIVTELVIECARPLSPHVPDYANNPALCRRLASQLGCPVSDNLAVQVRYDEGDGPNEGVWARVRSTFPLLASPAKPKP